MNTQSNKILSLLMLLAGGLLVGFSTGRWLAPMAAWIGPILILRYARDHTVGRGYLLVLAAFILAMSIAIGSFFAPPMGIFIVVAYGLLLSLPYLADRLVSPRLRGFASTFAFPLAATTLEFLNTRFNPMGTWGATGFSQYGNLPLMQLVSVTGMIGITFLVAWFAGVANWAWENRGRGSQTIRGLITFGVVYAIVFLFGALRLNLSPTSETDDTIRVAGITAQTLNAVWEYNETLDFSDPTAKDVMLQFVEAHRDAYFSETVREAQAGAKVILWSEGAGVGIDFEVATLIARAQEVARQYGVYLGLPLWIEHPESGQLSENKLLLIDPAGAIVIDHTKYGGTFLEGSIRGDGQLQFATTPFGVISGVICYDADFPVVIQQAGKNGTGLMLVPSKDWLAIDPVHSHMAVFRAIENGMSLVRQTDAGLSIAADPYGRVLAQTDYFGATDQTMVVQVPVKHVSTIYTLFGRWLEWLAPIGFLFFVARTLMARRQEE